MQSRFTNDNDHHNTKASLPTKGITCKQSCSIFVKRKFKVALFSFFGARSMGTNGASGRVFKEKKNNKNKHGETFVAICNSRFTYPHPFCPEQVCVKKRLEMC